MSRLIDAGLLLDHLSGRLESMKDYDAIKDVVNTMPTAYDVDKVVEQLEGLHEGYKCTDNEFQRGAKAGAHYVLNRAIEIVKGGGVNEC